jgi:PTS system glucose-specific IIC component
MTKKVIINKIKNTNNDKPVKINRSGNLKSFLSKISGAFMLPIAVMALAGLFLGVGATISGQAGNNEGLKVFGNFIKNLGDPIFGAMPILFAAAIVVAFTDDAGVGVFAAIVAYLVFSAIQSPFITAVYNDHGKSVVSLPTHKITDTSG